MIQAMIFDLDGTLVQTEKLKARSYARAAKQLRPETEEAHVVEAYRDVVGRPRREVAQELMDRFGLEKAAGHRMHEFGLTRPWQAFVEMRLRIHEEIIRDPEVIREDQWPHNVALVQQARWKCRYVALATVSHCGPTQQILRALGLRGAFDFIATMDDVENGKPAPEIYVLVARELQVSPEQCLVLEDSPTGVQSALDAGMKVVAVSTSFTREHLHNMESLDERWIVDDAKEVAKVVSRRIDQAAVQTE